MRHVDHAHDAEDQDQPDRDQRQVARGVERVEAGLEQELWQDVTGFMNRNPFERVAANWIVTHPAACERRYHELRQVNETLRELRLSPLLTLAGEAFFERSRAMDLATMFAEKPASWEAVVERLEQRLRC